MAIVPRQRSKERILGFDEADAHDFGEALKERFAGIRFRSFPPIRSMGGAGHGIQPPRSLPCHESLGDLSQWEFHVWIEPEGWQPAWQGPNERGNFTLANRPRLRFVFERGMRIPPPDGNDLGLGRIWSYYEADDREHLRFLNAVWRISQKLSTNVLDMVDRFTGEVTYPSQRTMIWAGYHALDWCRADPARRINETARPAADPTRPPLPLK